MQWEISSLKTDIKYIKESVNELKDELKNLNKIHTKITLHDEKICRLENLELKNSEKIRKVEDWKLKVMVVASFLASAISFLINKYL